MHQIGWLILAQAPDASEGIAEAASSIEVQSVWDFVVKGGLMMIPIALGSLIALTVIIERFISLRRAKVIPPTFLPELKRTLNGHLDDAGPAVDFCRRNGSPVANVFAAGLKRLGGPVEIVERHIQETGRREVLKLRRHLRVLSVVAAVSPLMGLLGTIFGMITAFQTVAMSADALGRTEMLAEGIYEAMITTAAGLVVAIPTLIFYHWLSAKVQRLVMDIDEMTVEFLEDLADGRLEVAAAPPLRPATDAAETRPPIPADVVAAT